VLYVLVLPSCDEGHMGVECQKDGCCLYQLGIVTTDCGAGRRYAKGQKFGMGAPRSVHWSNETIWGERGVGPDASIQLGARPRAYSPREDLHHKWARQLVESCDLLVVGPEDHMLRRSLRRPTCRVRAGSATGRRWRPRSMYAYVDGYAGGG
jgi:hypothetical protein